MRLLAKILPCINHSARLSCSTTNRRYTALVQVTPQNNFLVRNSLAARRTYGCKELIKQNNGLLKGSQKVPIRSAALIHSSSINNNSLKLFLIPLDWLHANEHSMRSTITSIFSKSQNLKRTGKLNSGLKNEKETLSRKSNRTNQKLGLKESQLVKYKNLRNSSAGQHKPENVDYMNILADDAIKNLKQIFVIRANAVFKNVTKNENNSVLALSVSPLKRNEIAWSKSMPLTEARSFLTNTFPLTLAKKSFSTSTSALMLNTFTKPKINFSQMSNILPQASYQIVVLQVVNPTIKRYESNNSFRCKPDPNYDFPYLSKIFGTETFLMRSDAYNQALAEADKRRAALKELKALNKKLCVHPLTQAHKANSGHKKAGPCKSKVKQNHCQKEQIKSENIPEIEKKKHKKVITGCVNPSAQVKQADGGCKKEGPCDSKGTRDGCQEEKDKIENMQEKIDRKKKHKIPTGCVSPKCKKGDKCSQNPKNSPCKKSASTTTTNPGVHELSSRPQTAAQEKALNSFNQKRPTNEEVIKAVIKTSRDCVCSSCKKGGEGGKGKSDTAGSGKSKPKTKKDTCKDIHSEYKPKCNSDPCKNDSAPCGEKKASPCKKKDSGGSKKGEPCIKKKPCGDKKKEDPCKKKDPCGDKKKEDPCKKKDPCGDKKKEDPCKKKDPCGDKKKEDPCKKKDSCGDKKKEDPCKKKDPCGDKKKEDPCKKKDPCGDKKKEDPCKKKEGPSKSCAAKQKDETKDKKSTCGALKGNTKPNCPNQRKFSTLHRLGYMRHYSSKKNKKGGEGKNSQCKTVQIHVPNQRKNITYPYPKDGLRQCYPIYDMDCTKFCKDPRKTACKKYTFLKDTDNNKRQNKK